VCGNSALLTGPSTPPAGAVVVPAGNNMAQVGGVNSVAGTTYWFAPGIHTLTDGEFSQIEAKANTTWIGAPGAILDGRGLNRYAFTGKATGVTIKYLEIRNFVSPEDEGVVNHDLASNWNVTNNYMHHNGGAALILSTNNVARFNCIDRNKQYGVQGFNNNLTIDRNEVSYNNTDGTCSGCSGATKFWDVNGANITGNWFHHNNGSAIWADTNDRDFLIDGNYISDNAGEAIFYEVAYNAKITNNTMVRNANVIGPLNPGFPTGAIYLSEAGGDARVPSRYTTIEISGNVFTDNWSGVVLWENADRFCNSPANTSTGYCTLVGAASTSTCVAPGINNPPLFDDCRWKTQNVSVHDNTFNHNPGAIAGCSPATGCGYNGIFSQWGTFPSWSPYQGQKIQDAITFSQNNVFARNTYKGPWQFMAHDMGNAISYTTWRAAPYNQDSGSTITP
ncbi:MAG: right-handed parallel beta-helix repeat-containing protein, partial [Acidimicrobiia bacterium]